MKNYLRGLLRVGRKVMDKAATPAPPADSSSEEEPKPKDSDQRGNQPAAASSSDSREDAGQVQLPNIFKAAMRHVKPIVGSPVEMSGPNLGFNFQAGKPGVAKNSQAIPTAMHFYFFGKKNGNQFIQEKTAKTLGGEQPADDSQESGNESTGDPGMAATLRTGRARVESKPSTVPSQLSTSDSGEQTAVHNDTVVFSNGEVWRAIVPPRAGKADEQPVHSSQLFNDNQVVLLSKIAPNFDNSGESVQKSQRDRAPRLFSSFQPVPAMPALGATPMTDGSGENNQLSLSVNLGQSLRFGDGEQDLKENTVAAPQSVFTTGTQRGQPAGQNLPAAVDLSPAVTFSENSNELQGQGVNTQASVGVSGGEESGQPSQEPQQFVNLRQAVGQGSNEQVQRPGSSQFPSLFIRQPPSTSKKQSVSFFPSKAAFDKVKLTHRGQVDSVPLDYTTGERKARAVGGNATRWWNKAKKAVIEQVLERRSSAGNDATSASKEVPAELVKEQGAEKNATLSASDTGAPPKADSGSGSWEYYYSDEEEDSS